MAKAENRLQLMKRLGAKQLNTVWSWCAVDEENRKVYFSAWIDLKGKKDGKVYYILQEPDWGIDVLTGQASPARNDHDDKFDLVFNHGYTPYAYFIEAEDTGANPRSIKNIKTSFIFSLDLEILEDGMIIGYPKERIEI